MAEVHPLTESQITEGLVTIDSVAHLQVYDARWPNGTFMDRLWATVRALRESRDDARTELRLAKRAHAHAGDLRQALQLANRARDHALERVRELEARTEALERMIQLGVLPDEEVTDG